MWMKLARAAYDWCNCRTASSSGAHVALVQKPGGIDNWNGPYLKGEGLPADPWNHPYVYRNPSERMGHDFDLCSLGASGNASVTSGGSGTGNSLAATVNIVASAGNSVVFTLTGTTLSSATGDLVNTATVTAPSGTTDPNLANNSATDIDTTAPVDDLSITKSDNGLI